MKHLSAVFLVLLLAVILAGLPIPHASADNVITLDQIENAISWAFNAWETSVKGKELGKGYYGYCGAFVSDAYENGAGLYIAARNHANIMGDQLITNTDMNPPRGAFVFWDITNNSHGHVGISLGDGTCVDSSNNTRAVTSINGHGSTYIYRGWGAPVAGYRLATQGSVPSSPPVFSNVCTIPDMTYSDVRANGFFTSGTITSDYAIKSVKAYFINASSGAVLSKPGPQTATMNTSTVDIRTQVDPVIYFAQLGVGTWKLVFEATNAYGETASCTTNAFSIIDDAPSIVFSNVCHIPDMNYSDVRANGFFTSGTITSSYPIKKVEGYFIYANTGALLSNPSPQSVSLNNTSVDIRTQVDQILYFASLQPGEWKLVLKATDSMGTTETYYSNSFRIIVLCDCSETVAGWYRVASTGLNINSGHNWNSYIGEMPPNALCWVSKGSLTANYYHVSYNGMEGISSKNYLTKIPSYTLAFDDQEGSGGPGTVTVWDGISDYSAVTVPSRSRYTFLGYYSAPSGGTQVYNANGQCTNEGTFWSGNAYVYGRQATLYAHWHYDYALDITVTPSALTLKPGGSGSLTAQVLPTDCINPGVTWSSENVQVAIVSPNGTVTAIAPGQTKIYAQTVDGTELTDYCQVTVQPILVTDITVHATTDTLMSGQTANLFAIVLPENATNQDVIWSSSNPAVASVTGGIVTGMSEGTVTVYAQAADGSGVRGECNLTIMPAVDPFFLNLHSMTMATDGIGSHSVIPYTLSPAEYADRIVWSSSSPDVAVVDASGTVSARGPGRTVITAEIPYGPSDACIVQVREDMSTLLLPASLERVETEAFEGTAADRAILGTRCTFIGPRAFASSSLRYILIPATVTEIAETAFDVSDQLAIVCSEGSAAQQYAISRSIRYIIDEEAAFVSVRSLSLPPTLSLEIEDTAELTCTVTPASASNPALSWVSSNESIAVVSSDGRVTGISPGKCEVTASTIDGSELSASCTVTVTLPDVTVQAAADFTYRGSVQLSAGITASLTLTGAEAGQVQQTGIFLYDADGNRLGYFMGEPVPDSGALKVLCDTDSDMHLALTPETVYQWRACAVIKGITFFSSFTPFTTPALPPVIVLSTEALSVQAGSSSVLSAQILYTDDTEIIWRTSNSGIAMVIDGEVVARAPGKAIITVQLLSDPQVTATCEVTVMAESSQSSAHTLVLSASELTLTRGDTALLEAVVSPPPGPGVQWGSSDETVAVVTGNGTVSAWSAGCAYVFAWIPSEGLQAQCAVTVLPRLVESVTLSASSLHLYTGGMDTLLAQVLPAHADDRRVIWVSSSPDVVQVENGVLHALSPGTAVLTASAADGSGCRAECAVTVENPPPNCGCQASWAGEYVIVRTGGTGLAISSGHAASTSAGMRELALIPEGETVWISRASGPAGQSGCWGHVTYQGVSGYCSMYYVDPVLNVDTSAEKVNPVKLQAVIDRANAWADYVWTALADIPVYNNDYDDPEDPAAYRQEFWYPQGTEMHGVPYTLASSKYRPDTYQALSSANKATPTTFTYEGWLMWGPRYGGDCTCLVNDVLWAGDPSLPHDGQVYMTKKAYLYSTPAWDELAPGDALASSGHAMIVTDVRGENVTIVESRGNGSTVGAIRCQNLTKREQGGWYVCGTCTYCNGTHKCGAIRRTVSRSELRSLGYSIKRYKPLYTD